MLNLKCPEIRVCVVYEMGGTLLSVCPFLFLFCCLQLQRVWPICRTKASGAERGPGQGTRIWTAPATEPIQSQE